MTIFAKQPFANEEEDPEPNQSGAGGGGKDE